VLYFVRMFSTHDYRFLTRIAEEGHTVFFLRLEDKVLESRPLPDAVQIVHWPNGDVHWSGKPQDQVKALQQVVSEVKPDVVQAGPVQTTAFLCVLAQVKPLVVMSWGYDILFDAEKDDVWHMVTSTTLQSADGYICDCDALYQKAVAYGLPETVSVAQFPWGIDTERFKPLPEAESNVKRDGLGWSSSEFVILSLRNWEPIYDVETVVKAFCAAFEENKSLRLMLLGGGSRESHIMDIVEASEARTAIAVIGRVSQDDLPRYYHAADLYVSASHTDGTSISLLESFGSGTPVCVSDIPANHEWVTEGIEGSFFPVGDSDTLTNKLLSAASTAPDQRQVQGERVREVAVQRAQWNENSTRMFATHQAAVERHS